MIITRRDILKAIRTEKLKNQNWITLPVLGVDDYGYKITGKPSSTCKVCAVGAVLRTVGIPNNRISITAGQIVSNGNFNSGEDELAELREGRYMNALSVRFENLAKKYGCGKKTKEILIRFVKRHFPKTIEIEA